MILLQDENQLVRFEHTGVDPWQYSYDTNIARRHLTTFAKCAFADAWREHEEQAARRRQAELNNKSLEETLPQAREPQSRDKIGAAIGISGKSVPCDIAVAGS